MNEGIQIPDRFNPLLGIRQFLVTKRGNVISPNRRGYRWDNGWKKARCSPGWKWERVSTPHTSPHPDCSCGIQVGYDLHSLAREGTIIRNAMMCHERNLGAMQGDYDLAGRKGGQRKVVYGLVAARGDIRKFDYLMKVEEAGIIGFVAPPGRYRAESNMDKLDLEFLAMQFGVSMVDYSTERDIRPVDMAHIAPLFNCEYWNPNDPALNTFEPGWEYN